MSDEEEEEESSASDFPSESEILKAFPKIGSEKAKNLSAALAAAFDENADDDAVDDAMEAASEILDGHGVEAIKGDGANVDKYWRDTVLLYVNMGDTYDTTILYDTEEDSFSIGSWGDFMEEWEKGGDEEEEEEEEEEEDEGEEEESAEVEEAGE